MCFRLCLLTLTATALAALGSPRSAYAVLQESNGPTSSAQPMHPEVRAMLPTALDLIRQQPDAAIFLELVDLAKLHGVLQGPFQITAFVPADATFSSELLELLRDPKNVALVRNVVALHLVWGDISPVGIESVLMTRSVQGQTLLLQWRDQQLHVASAIVTQADLMSRNGLVHRIDQVLLPPILRRNHDTGELIEDGAASDAGPGNGNPGTSHSPGCAANPRNTSTRNDPPSGASGDVRNQRVVSDNGNTDGGGKGNVPPTTPQPVAPPRPRSGGGCGCGFD